MWCKRIYSSGIGLIRVIAVALLLSVSSFNGKAFCQCRMGTTVGSDFWVMFLNNYYVRPTLSLIAAGNSNAMITVENPRMHWRTTANLTAGIYVTIPIPDSVAKIIIYDSVLDAGLHITSTADISLYASNFRDYSYDITTVFPTRALGVRYISQDYPDDGLLGAELGVVAIEDSTDIYIVGYDTVRLMRGQTYQINQRQAPYTFSGVEVFSNYKPFAMFQGNKCTYVPATYPACDHMYEQSVPVEYWGKDFVVAPAQVRRGSAGNGDIVRITSSQDSCDILIDNNLVQSNLNKGATYETIVPYTTVNRIHTSKPSTVCLYLSGCTYGGQPGDPASVIIPPIEQGVCEAVFAAYNTSMISSHYANIVVETSNVPAMRLDTSSIASYFSQIDSVYSFAQINVSRGTHSLRNQWGEFVAYFYGLGDAESYAYTAGMGLRSLQEGLQINYQPVRTAEDTIGVCVCDTVFFRLNTNSGDTSALWYIDDSLINVSQLSFSHYFNQLGAYRITAITHGLCDTLWCDTLEGVVKITAPGVDTVYYPVCEHEVFNYMGHVFSGLGPHQFSYRSMDVCDSIRVVMAYQHDTLRDTVNTSICAGATYINNGDSILMPGFYRWTVRTAIGCDSVSYVNLTVNDTLRDTVRRTICDMGRFDTNGITYYQRGFYTQLLRDTSTGCYHNLVIDLTVLDTIFDTIYPVICAGGSFDTDGVRYSAQGVYIQYMRDTSNGCFHQIVINLSVNDTIRDTIHPTICFGGSFDTNGHLGCAPVSGQNYLPYYVQGVYTQHLRDTSNGCFHNLVIDLAVNDTIRDTVRPRICAGGSFDTNGVRYTAQGVYTQYMRDTSNGCFRNLVIDLAVNDTIRDTFSSTICAGDTLQVNGFSYSRQGFYSQMSRRPDGCFSILVIDVFVKDTLRDTICRTICAGTSFDTNGVSYSRPGFYKQVVSDLEGCLHTLYINLAVTDTIRDTIHPTICIGSTFDTNGVSYSSPGIYKQVVRDTEGCLRNLFIDLTVTDTIRDTIYPTICLGSSFDTNGMSYSVQGLYKQVVRDSDGCLHKLFINLAVNDTIRDTIRRIVCAGAVLNVNGVPYAYPGLYKQVVRDSGGCFHNIVLDLSVRDTIRDTLQFAICPGAVLDTNGHLGYVPVSGQNYPPYYVQGVYTQHLRHPTTGCFRNLVINLSVSDTLRDTIHPVICAGEQYNDKGSSYTRQGFYSLLWRDNETRCYNRRYIDLIVNDTFRNVIWQNVCAGATFTYGGQSYSRQGTYLQRNYTVNGCDSITEIHLTVSDTLRDTLRFSLCAGQTAVVNGQSYANRGWHRQLLRTANGCDSVISIHISVSDTLRDTLRLSLCAGQTAVVNGQSYANSGWHRQKLRTADGCDSVLDIHLTVFDTIRDTINYGICLGQSVEINGNTYTRQGMYRQDLRTVAGCDSIIYISVMVDTPKNLHASFKIYPQSISMRQMQIKFSDYSTGNPFDRKWIFHEVPDRYEDVSVLHNRFAYYTPHYESDSLRVMLVIMTNMGCTDSATASYPILKGEVWVPGAFTPDADVNKTLKVGHYNIETYEIMIFNRQGMCVFHSTDIEESWDGTHNGRKCPPATYVYKVIYTTKSQPANNTEKSGTVLLIR